MEFLLGIFIGAFGVPVVRWLIDRAVGIRRREVVENR